MTDTVYNYVRQGAYDVIEALRLANSDDIAQTGRARPASPGSMPYIYVGDTRINMEHSSGVRSWEGEQDVVIVDMAFDNEDQQARVDGIISLVINAFSDNPHFAHDNSVGDPVRTRPAVEDFGAGQIYPAVIITIGDLVFKEGR